VRRTYLLVMPRSVHRPPSQQEKNTRQMSRQSNYYQLHLDRGKVTRDPESLSDAGSAEREGRAQVMRVDDRARITYAEATPAVRAHASTVKKGAV
jgi:hypothetical protein